MKKFFRFMLLGVCLLFRCSTSVAANTQVVPTFDTCVSGELLSIDLEPWVRALFFSLYEEKDKPLITKWNTDTITYDVDYGNPSFRFSENGVAREKKIALPGLESRTVQCTVRYTRTINFKVKNVHQNSLWGIDENGCPNAKLVSEREWFVNLVIKKRFPKTETFDISGERCLGNSEKFSIPDKYADMECQWFYDKGIVSVDNEKVHRITVTKKSDAKFLATRIRCRITGVCADTIVSTKEIRISKTPASELSFVNCLSTDSNWMTVKASNSVSGVEFDWKGLSSIKKLQSNASFQEVRGLVPGRENFTIGLITRGGCIPDTVERVVQRDLGSNIRLQVLSQCPTTGVPFDMATDPLLPNMILKWKAPEGYQVDVSEERSDVVSITKPSGWAQTVGITVQNAVCSKPITDYVSISEAYTEMEARLASGYATGLLLNSGDSVPPQSKIKFTAPQHSSISSYMWTTSYGDGRPATQWQSTQAEFMVTAPSNGYFFTVTVTYTSCYGPQRHTYRLKSMNEYFEIFGK